MANKAAPAITISIVLALLSGGAIFILVAGYFFIAKNDSAHEQEHMTMLITEANQHEKNLALIQKSDIQKYGPNIPKSGFTKEHFVAITQGDSHTKLAKRKFHQSLAGTQIQWAFNVREIEAHGNSISAELSFPYRIEYQNGSSGGTCYFTTSFPASAEDNLINYKTGDSITVSGRFYVSENGTPSITDAKVASP